MFQKIKYACLSLMAMALLGSCGDFLKEESQSEVIPKTTEDFSELLVGSGYPDGNGPSLAKLALMDDDCSFFFTFFNNGEANPYIGSNDAINMSSYYTWQPTESDLDGAGTQINTTASNTEYAKFYTNIMGCNAVLDQIDDAVGEQKDRDRVKAEALAVRALLYFQLVNIYGEPYNYNKDALGVPLKLTADLKQEMMARATVKQVYEDCIVPDLQEACRLMDPLLIRRKNYHINQPAIHILLSRVYLYMERYQDCIDEVNKAEEQGARLMNLNKELETVMNVEDFSFVSYDNPEMEWIFGSSCFNQNSPYCPGTNPEFRALFDEENDLRFKYFSLKADDHNNVYPKPYAALNLNQSLRFGEAYLNRMEANALLHNDAEALKQLNDFRRTRIKDYQDVTGLSGQKLLNEIRTERRKELCYEGQRWFDLRREGMPEIKHRYQRDQNANVEVFTLKHNDPLYTLPLPSSLWQSNAGLQQNVSRDEAERVGEAEK